jgi:hypothetical protein
MWEKLGRYRQATDDDIIRCMRISCWIRKAKHTHSEYAIIIGFERQQWFWVSASLYRMLGGPQGRSGWMRNHGTSQIITHTHTHIRRIHTLHFTHVANLEHNCTPSQLAEERAQNVPTAQLSLTPQMTIQTTRSRKEQLNTVCLHIIF